MSKIQKRGKLIVGLPLGAAPFASKDETSGAIEGFDVEIARQIAIAIFGSEIENKIEFLDIDPLEREVSLENNRVDIAMSRYEITVARKKLVDFAGPYYVAKQVAVKDRKSRGTSLLDLAGRKVCVVPGSTDVDLLKKEAPGVDVTSFVRTTVQECGVALKNGAVDAVVSDEVDAQPLLRDSALGSINKAYGDKGYGIGVHKGTDDFRTFINERLDGKTAKVWDTLYERTVGKTGAKSSQPETDRY